MFNFYIQIGSSVRGDDEKVIEGAYGIFWIRRPPVRIGGATGCVRVCVLFSQGEWQSWWVIAVASSPSTPSSRPFLTLCSGSCCCCRDNRFISPPHFIIVVTVRWLAGSWFGKQLHHRSFRTLGEILRGNPSRRQKRKQIAGLDCVWRTVDKA